MGSSVKKIAGVALLAFSYGLTGVAAYSTLATTAIVGSITYGTVAGIIGLSILGTAMAADIGDMTGADNYAGVKLQTQKTNTAPVPIVYGTNKLAGNIIWQTTSNVISPDSSSKGYNRDYWAVIVFSQSNFHGLRDIFSNEKSMVHDGWMAGMPVWASKSHTPISGSAEAIMGSVQAITGSTGSDTPQSIRNLLWPTKTHGGNYVNNYGSDLGFPDINIPKDVSYILAHQVFDGENNKNVQLANITLEIAGRTIRRLESNSISELRWYSHNPAEITLDLLTRALSISDNDIDISSFYKAKTICNANSWSCNIALVQQANIQSIIQDVLSTCRGQITYSNGKWKMGIDSKFQPVVSSLNDDDFIVNSVSISMKNNREIANKIIVKYVNPDDNWLSAQVVKEDVDLQEIDGQVLEKTLDIKGVTNQPQAEKLAEIALNTMRYSQDLSGNRIKQTPLSITFATTVKNANLEVGDVVEINSDLLDRVRSFLIVSIDSDQSGVIQIAGREYCETHYKNSAGNYLI